MAYETGFMGGKQMRRSLPSLASHNEEFRRETTAWGVLVWAYADEIVRAASSVGGSNFPTPRLAQSSLGRECVSTGLINGWYEPHRDARLIHAKLQDWFDHDPGQGIAVMSYAERRQLVPPSITVPRVRVVPQLDRNGNVLIQRHRAPGRGRVIAEYCLLDYEGTDARIAEQREAAWVEFYRMFIAFLDVMPGFPLTRWKITKRGLTNVEESLTR